MFFRGQKIIAYTTRTVLAVAIIVVGIIIYVALIHTGPRVEQADPSGSLRHVEVFAATKLPIRRQWRGFGTAAAMDSSNVPSRVTATVVHIPKQLRAGVTVEKGQLLARLDASDLEQQVEIAASNIADLDAQIRLIDVERNRITKQLELETRDIELARRELDRFERLYEQGAAKQRELDTATRTVIASEIAQVRTQELIERLNPRKVQLRALRDGAASSLYLAKLNLDRCTIVSPISGVLQSVDIEVGENVNAGAQIARIVDLSEIDVPVRLPASARRYTAVGNRVTISAMNRSGLSWAARIARIAPEDDQDTRTMTVFVEVDQRDAMGQFKTMSDAAQLLTPGVFVEGIVTSDGIEQRWAVPRRAVAEGRVFVIEDRFVRSREVRVEFLVEGLQPQTGLPDNQWAVLDDSLAEGDLIVTVASTSVLEGEQVIHVLAHEIIMKAEAQRPSRKEATP